jgi:hypothetical protein
VGQVKAPLLVLAIVLAGSSQPGLASSFDEPPSSFSGRVVELDTNRPISGATVVVRRSKIGEQAVETALQTDSEGGFTVDFTPEQAAEPGFSVGLSRVSHPDFVSRKGSPVPLANLILGRRFGEKPYFDTVKLERGLEYSGEVVTPDGKPAADVAFGFENWSRSNRDNNFLYNDNTGKTDADGRFRLRMPQTQSLAIRLTPATYAPFQQFWGTDKPAANPDVYAPTELGRIVLAEGPVLSGRAVDLDGRPIAGLRVVVKGTQSQHHREATTAADGSFRFAPLRTGNYVVFAEGQYQGASIDSSLRPIPASTRVIRPAKVYVREGATPSPVELRELPSVAVEIRFIDAKGNPARGGYTSLSGMIPSDEHQANSLPGGISSASTINEVETEETDKTLGWGCQLWPDSSGKLVVRVPRGLADADLFTVPPDESLAFKTRLVPGGPVKFWGGGRLGTIDADRPAIEILVYQSPMVIATIKTEEGEPVPEDASVNAHFEFRGGSFGGNVVRQADGRFRSQSLMPDHEYQFSAGAKGYVSKGLEWVNLREGASAELSLVIRKLPKPPVVGDLARPFALATVDGRILNLADFRGKYLVLHAWSPFHRGDRDLLRFEAIRKRFGDDRLGLLGLALTSETEEVRKLIETWKIGWPQAILPNAGADPIIEDLGGLRPPESILIGPDGRILALDLSIDKIEQMLARLIGGK